ncbi:hypothetical protein FHR83_006674 [Actinoplanes campanulatus]|uniref:Uncharacterized protein n=1 Tax=Actinoplanes campanulatus TaxID=113559 RepID=A0A7W5AMF2_9ACTN|nr:hypothetical protein [Actinoplanes campanulatus]MBB3098968.1 hypothetical protein [Actinoplanes campanulatus]GGN39650.1 hypothetical protein GCM10010109_67820 [Actinoplanes campanulatus]
MPDLDRLPPTQQLILDTLAARYRLGEQVWTFSTVHGKALRALEQAGLVTLLNGIVEHSTRARLTEAGKAAVLSGDYQPPNGGIDRLRAALTDIAEHAEARAHYLGMEPIAVIARQALESGPA